MRPLLALLGSALLLACGFGLAATLEPLDADSFSRWRLVYGSGALAGLVLVGLALTRRSKD